MAGPSRSVLYTIDRETLAWGRATSVDRRFVERLDHDSQAFFDPTSLTPPELQALLDESDRQLEGLMASRGRDDHWCLRVDSTEFREALPCLVSTGRFHLGYAGGTGVRRLAPWQVVPAPGGPRLTLTPTPKGDAYKLTWHFGGAVSGTDPSRIEIAMPNGFAFSGQTILDFGGPIAPSWVDLFHAYHHEKGVLPEADLSALLARLSDSDLERVELSGKGPFRNEALQPEPLLRLSRHGVWPPQQRFKAEVLFAYGNVEVDVTSDAQGAIDLAAGVRMVRRKEAEEAFMAKLSARRAVVPDSFGRGLMAITSKMVELLPELVNEQWRVESLGQPVRVAQGIRCRITSRIDWFDLNGVVTFGGLQLPLAKAVALFKTGGRLSQLSDGTFALLPAEQLSALAPLYEMAQPTDDGALRLARSQAVLLDGVLAMQNVTFDADRMFQDVRDALAKHRDTEEVDAPEGFTGVLRGYQREGLAWLLYLRDAGCGGCLADDMGLGKTIQVLALLEHVRATSEQHVPCLAVVPRSLLVNWQREAERFTPGIRTHIYHGSSRALTKELLRDVDLVLTTYGTLRNDAPFLAETQFDTCILDEAQTVKNAATQTAKAVRIVNARHRLVLTGTPIENHLGDLWSIFEFLNPGMLGRSSRFRRLIDAPKATADSDTLKLIASAVRPLLLRRTKEQVLTDLPDKTETTLYCELEGAQKAAYEQLLEVVRADLLGVVKQQGLNRSKIRVIEALLRLRQCACHPGLVDESLVDAPSAKLEMLLNDLREICEEGHKALVFSQFTAFLALAKRELDNAGITYEYLDGRTRKRQKRVDRFQSDPACQVFLISLKAGGLGLNLTAADYVYILDPWWNPAVESQAVDRSHRIGQTRKVFAYRLVARGTVEEKVLQLQQRKRDLADAILTADKSVMKKLDLVDLELLLS